MPDEKYFDILITDDDITLDVGGIPERCCDRDSIAQDLVHMIRETGLLVELVGNRDEGKKAENIVKLTLEVDNDERIVPGTCQITETSLGVFYLQAETVEFGPIYSTVEIS
ncbi:MULTISPECIES: DUF2590 family protein [unclassified Pseudodesulfovibrio]|uniref:DUF2590 family protein n=1 Tax=unclassified Pseudodesulfovibrio TaxID=2661612 RepID=UPI000FEBC788|nr:MULTISPECIES: DUF2590 family protein [unclassified Pseudodesulfovibrio]MCJ2164661.1 DUF2590 family protein [Pseudodesulfovibrio sp. S3-i]RWU04147.1 DUF2590 family protein [Pseudodesulfovibrio sp. S3]